MFSSDMQVEPTDDGQSGAGLSIREIVDAIIGNFWMIAAIVAAAVAIGYYVIRNTPVAYRSNGVLLIETAKDQILVDIKGIEAEQRYRPFDIMNTIAASVMRSDVLLVAAERIKSEPFVRGWSTNELSTNQIARILAGKCEAKSRRASMFVDVFSTDGDPVAAQIMVQALMEAYIAGELNKRWGTGKGATNFLGAEAERLKIQLDSSEKLLSNFLRTNTVSVMESDDLVSAELKSLSARLSETRSARMKLETDWEQIKGFADEPDKLRTVPSVNTLQNVAELRRQLLDLESEIAQLEQRYKAKHPKMIEAQRARARIQQAYDIELRSAPMGIQLELKRKQLEETQLMAQLVTQEGRVAELNELRFIYNGLKSKADQDRKLYESVVRRLGEVSVNMRLSEREDMRHEVNIFEDAYLPRSPFSPNKTKILATSLVAGLGFSLGLVYLLLITDQTLKSVDHAERVFGVPVLGAIPKSEELKGDNERLILSKSPDSHAAEGFRTLRAAVGLLGREDERKVTMFTSAVPGEGKTFCSSNYALASAQAGKRTILVDFDLRRPSVGKTFGIPSEQEGVSDCLLGKTKYDEVLVPTENAHLFVIAAGTMVPNPSELITSLHAKEFIEELRNAFDHVVIDNAPVTAVSDTLLLVGCVDTVCLVTKAAKTAIRVIGRSIELIRRAGVNPSGVILNFITQRRGGGYHYYYYYSDKKYGGGYGSERRKKSTY